MDKETREYIRQEISRRKFAEIPRDSLGRRIVLNAGPNNYSSNPGDWMPSSKKNKNKFC